MATPLARFSWGVLRKNRFQRNHLLIFPCVNHFPSHRRFSVQQEKYFSKILNKTVNNALTYTVLFTGLGYILYKWKDDVQEQLRSLSKNFMPTVHARSIPAAGGNDYRDKYNFIADVVEISAPSVVFISIEYIKGSRVSASNGSGFIIEPNGVILTNAHVVSGRPNTTVNVRLNDGSVHTGVVEDVDTVRDLAIVRIKKNNLPVLQLGNSSDIRPGEFVVAIGSPLSLSNSVTSGVISSVNRQSQELGMRDKKMGYIQTDAAVTFGNSGGPLVNLNGEVIGINAMKVTSGISFAIPIDSAKEFLQKTEKRRKKGKDAQNISSTPSRRYMGIIMYTLTPDIIFELQQRTNDLPPTLKYGVMIYKVVVGSPAYAGGLYPGDIIVEVNDEPVTDAATMYQAIETSKVLNLTIIRRTAVIRKTIQLDES